MRVSSVLVYAAVARRAGRSPRGVAARPAGTCRAACAAPGTTRPTGPRPPFAARAQPRQSRPGLTARPWPLRICTCRPRPPSRPAAIAALAWPLATSQRPGGRGALAARRLAEGLAGCCLGLPSFLSSSPCPVTLPWPMPAPGIAALACSPGPCAALRAAACARVPLPALALRPQCTGRRTQERRRQQSPELPQCPQNPSNKGL